MLGRNSRLFLLWREKAGTQGHRACRGRNCPRSSGATSIAERPRASQKPSGSWAETMPRGRPPGQ